MLLLYVPMFFIMLILIIIAFLVVFPNCALHTGVFRFRTFSVQNGKQTGMLCQIFFFFILLVTCHLYFSSSVFQSPSWNNNRILISWQKNYFACTLHFGHWSSIMFIIFSFAFTSFWYNGCQAGYYVVDSTKLQAYLFPFLLFLF